MNLKTLSLKELKSLKGRVEKEIARRATAEKKKALKELAAIAAARGFELEELLGTRRGRAKPVRRRAPVRTKGPAKYRNPDNPQQTWSGRGRKPQWVQAWLAAGKSLDALKL
ncbi:H-NS histone family protein [Thiobacter aerophilum]|uniref:H-NS histone family protein n=1 Tax=Thiobacter aerophilum TaxID=3121275 RepID=A0ABV0EDK5_9BURK